MSRDLEGQQTFWPEAGRERERRAVSPPAGVTLPGKATCTVAEAAGVVGITPRQAYNWVRDGTLLAVNSARHPVTAGRTADGKRGLDRWRVVVRRGEVFGGEAYRASLTLDELLARITNVTAD